MAKRHEVPEHKLYSRVRDIGPMLATGHGVARIPSRMREPSRNMVLPTEPTPRVYTGAGLLALTANMLAARGVVDVEIDVPRGATITEFFDAPGSLTECDMRDYWRLIRERRALLAEIEWDNQRKLFPGWQPPAAVSPFGHDRFRVFDPTPAFEFTAGPIHFIGR